MGAVTRKVGGLRSNAGVAVGLGNGVGASAIANSRTLESLPLRFAAEIATKNRPARADDPLIRPVERSIDKPEGNAPIVLKEIGELLAVIW